MNAFVTGGLGFIGSHIVDLLIRNGFDVTVLDNLSTGREQHLNPAARWIRKDLEDVAARDLEGMEYVFHCAALPRIQPSFDEPEIHETANVIATLRLIGALKGNPTLKKLVVSASSSCYGDPRRYPTPEDEPVHPLNPYALQKYAAEQYALLLGERFGIPVNTLRYFNVYGPRSFNEQNVYNAYSSVIGIFHHQKTKGTPLTITGDGSQRRDFVHVYDVAEANLKAAMTGVTFASYNVGAGECYSVLEIAGRFDHPFVFIPERKGEALITHADIGKIRNELNWTPAVGLEEGTASYDSQDPREPAKKQRSA